MNYLKPRQREHDQKWDYTSMNDGVIHPIGYCHAFRPLDPKIIPVSEEQIAAHAALADKYHTDGHTTPEEACECYKQYLLDHHLRLGRNSPDEQRKCQICDAWTTSFATVDTIWFVLCEEHNTRETVDSLMEAPSEIWTS